VKDAIGEYHLGILSKSPRSLYRKGRKWVVSSESPNFAVQLDRRIANSLLAWLHPQQARTQEENGRWRRRTGQETTKTRLKRRERTNDEGNLTAEPLIVLLLGGSSLVHGGVMTRSITWYQGGLPSASEWLVLYPRTTLVSVLWSLQYESSPDGGYLICSSLRATLDWFAVLKLNPMHFFSELFPSGYRFLLRGGTLSWTRTLEDTSTYDDKNKTHCSVIHVRVLDSIV